MLCGMGEELRLRSSLECYSDATGWLSGALTVRATQLCNADLDMRAHAGRCYWGQKPLTSLPIQRKTSLLSVNLQDW